MSKNIVNIKIKLIIRFQFMLENIISMFQKDFENLNKRKFVQIKKHQIAASQRIKLFI